MTDSLLPDRPIDWLSNSWLTDCLTDCLTDSALSDRLTDSAIDSLLAEWPVELLTALLTSSRVIYGSTYSLELDRLTEKISLTESVVY